MPQQPARLARPAAPTASSTRSHAARERYGAARVALVARHLDLEHRRDRRRLSRGSTPDGRLPADTAPPARAHAAFARRFRAAGARARGPCVTVATACSSSAKVFAQAERLIAPRPRRRGASSAASTRCAAACCSASTRCELVSPEPCRPFDADAQRHQHRRGGGLRAARARRRGARAAAARLRRIERRAPHVDAASRRPRRRARARRCAGARRPRRRGDVDYINLHGTASAEERRGRSARSSPTLFPAATARQLDQGLDRPHARRGRHRRGGDQPARASSTACMPGTLNTRDARSGLRPADPPRQRATARVRLALSNSFGFGGNNCVLAVRRRGRA